MTAKPVLFAAAMGLVAAPALVSPAIADSAKDCAAAWKTMSPAYQAMTGQKEFMATCQKTPAERQAEILKANKTKLNGDGCHDYSECTNREVVSDPR